MRAFINVAEEFPKGHPDRESFIYDYFTSVNLNLKINRRGNKEQYATILLNHYYVDEPIIHRRRKTSHYFGSRLYINGVNLFKIGILS